MKKAMLPLVVCMLAIPAAFAGGTWSNVTVTQILPCTSAEGCGTNGFVQVQFSANSTGTPACVNTSDKAWAAVDVSTPIGAYMAGVLQAARLTGQTVTAYGIGSCSLYANTMETLGGVAE